MSNNKVTKLKPRSKSAAALDTPTDLDEAAVKAVSGFGLFAGSDFIVRRARARDGRADRSGLVSIAPWGIGSAQQSRPSSLSFESRHGGHLSPIGLCAGKRRRPPQSKPPAYSPGVRAKSL